MKMPFLGIDTFRGKYYSISCYTPYPFPKILMNYCCCLSKIDLPERQDLQPVWLATGFPSEVLGWPETLPSEKKGNNINFKPKRCFLP
jgi:hypothetical protein